MAKKKEDVVEVVEEAAIEKQPEEKKNLVSSNDLKNSMLEVGLKSSVKVTVSPFSIPAKVLP